MKERINSNGYIYEKCMPYSVSLGIDKFGDVIYGINTFFPEICEDGSIYL